MRVIAGKYRSRPLRSLRGMDIRPTSDRLRETLFNVLTAGNPAALEGSVWLDLFAGTGAVGIEALSRGAKEVHFVENSAPAADVIRGNLQSLGITEASASHAIESLMRAAMANLADAIPDDAMTGPVVRGDSATVGKHIKGLKSSPSALLVYRALSSAAVEIAERNGLDQERIAALRGTIAATERMPAPERGL